MLSEVVQWPGAFLTPEELTGLKDDVATIKAVLTGIPGTASRGIVGDLLALKDDISQRFDRVYKSLETAGTKYISGEAASATFVSKKECGDCPKRGAPVVSLTTNWRFWLFVTAITLLLLGSNADKLAALLKVFGLS